MNFDIISNQSISNDQFITIALKTIVESYDTKLAYDDDYYNDILYSCMYIATGKNAKDTVNIYRVLKKVRYAKNTTDKNFNIKLINIIVSKSYDDEKDIEKAMELLNNIIRRL